MSGNFKIGSVLEKIEIGVNTALKFREKIEAGVNKALKFGEKAFIDRVKKAQNTITVVYDGKAPYIAARSIYEYLQSLGYSAKLVDTDKYAEDSLEIIYGKVIIVGHHTLAKKQLQCISFLQCDSYGMKFGFCGNRCVLKASRSALGRGKKGRNQFSDYYDSRMIYHEKLANKYGTPMCFGLRDETRKSQYDLLWLEFVTYGLSEFLADIQIQENIAEKASADLLRQLEADKDRTFTLEEIQQNIYEQNECAGMETLHRHLGNDIVCTGVWADAKEKYDLEDSELLEGELSACTFTIGCYTIRSAQRLYKDTDEVHYTEKIPANQEEITSFKENRKGLLALFPTDDGIRLVHEISAKHHAADTSAFPEGWKYICLATTSISWSESIDFIGTIKSKAEVPDEQADLFVLKTYTGDSFGTADWYKLDADGAVSEYQEHPYNSDSFKASWKNSSEKQTTELEKEKEI